MLKEIRVCDCCGKEFKDSEHVYHLDFNSEKYVDAAGDVDYDFKRIDLCANCIENVMNSLKVIASKKNIHNNDYQLKESERNCNNCKHCKDYITYG